MRTAKRYLSGGGWPEGYPATPRKPPGQPNHTRVSSPRNIRRMLRLIAKQNGKCWLCGLKLHISEATFDHRVPRSKGGSNALSNLAAAHSACNSARGNKFVNVELSDAELARIGDDEISRAVNREINIASRKPRTQELCDKTLAVLRLHPAGISENLLSLESGLSANSVHKALSILATDKQVRRERPADPVKACDWLQWRAVLIQ